MPLTSGTRLGTYELLAPLGAGGMGEVYRARDTKLNREVAIKVLPESITAGLGSPPAASGDRLARFGREAQVLAALNHPHIAQVYDAGEGPGGAPYIVMELVDGPSLADEIAHPGGLSIERALKFARQIALALDAAHEKGIVHRDLKPANIKITSGGDVKVLDFGLAKMLDAGGAGPATGTSPTTLPTMTSPAMTGLGMILGTAAYMAPEQARGKAVDKRADIWAFGCVLYEMLTGRQAFGGETVTDILGAIIHKEPDWSALPASLPPAVAELVRRCLQKDVRTRQRDIGDALAALDSLMGSTGAAASAAGTIVGGVSRPSKADAGSTTRRAGIPASMATALAVVAAAAGAGLTWLLVRPADPPPVPDVKFAIAAPDGQSPTGVAITPAGDTVIVEADRLYVRRIDDTTLRPMPGTEGARNVFVSHDGRWVGFMTGGALKKIALAGGDALTIGQVSSDTPGAAWSEDGTILFSPGWSGPLHKIPADGGTPAPLTTLDTTAAEVGHWWPDVLPGGTHATFTIWRAGIGLNDARIGVVDLRTGAHRLLMPGSFSKFLAPDRLVYFHAGAYHVVGFDPRTQATTGEPRRVLDDAMPQDPLGTRLKTAAVSRTGAVAYLAGSLNGEHKLAWLAAGGAVEDLPFPARPFGSLSLSPDGRAAAATRIENGKYSIWLYDLPRGTETDLALPGSSFGPVWSPDGQSVAYTSLIAGHFDVHTVALNDRTPRSLVDDALDQSPAAYVHDLKRMLLAEYKTDRVEFTLLDLASPATRTPIGLRADELDGVQLSSDDRWLAVESARAGRSEIVVHGFPTPGAGVQVSRGGGVSPFWGQASKTLYYQRGKDILAVTYRDGGGRFEIVKEERVVTGPDFSLYGLATDGRFLIGRDVTRHRVDVQVRTVLR